MAGRDVKRVYHAQQRGQQHNFPNGDPLGEGQRGENERRIIGGGLGGDDDQPAIPAVRDDSAQRREQENRETPDERDRTEQESGMGQAVDQPGFADGLHPSADQRNHLAAEKVLKIAMSQRAKGYRQTRALADFFRDRYFGRGGGGGGVTCGHRFILR